MELGLLSSSSKCEFVDFRDSDSDADGRVSKFFFGAQLELRNSSKRQFRLSFRAKRRFHCLEKSNCWSWESHVLGRPLLPERGAVETGGAAFCGGDDEVHLRPRENAGAWTRGSGDKRQAVCTYIDEEGRNRCAITAKRGENSLSFYNGESKPCSARMERDGVLMVKLKGKFVLFEQDEPFEEEKGTGTMKQHPRTFAMQARANMWHGGRFATSPCTSTKAETDRQCCAVVKSPSSPLTHTHAHTHTHTFEESSAYAAGEVPTFPRKLASDRAATVRWTVWVTQKKAPLPMRKDDRVTDVIQVHQFGCGSATGTAITEIWRVAWEAAAPSVLSRTSGW